MGTSAKFCGPSGIVVASTGAMLIADSWNQMIRVLTTAGLEILISELMWID